MLDILTTLFCYQYNNQETFLICDLNHYLTKVKYHSNVLYIKFIIHEDFKVFITIYIGSKNKCFIINFELNAPQSWIV